MVNDPETVLDAVDIHGPDRLQEEGTDTPPARACRCGVLIVFWNIVVPALRPIWAVTHVGEEMHSTLSWLLGHEVAEASVRAGHAFFQ